MRETNFEVIYFPGVIKTLTLLIMSRKHPEVEVGVAMIGTGETHLITIKIEIIQLTNRLADERFRKKHQPVREIVVNLYGQCFASQLRGWHDYACVDLEFDLLSKQGNAKVRVPL